MKKIATFVLCALSIKMVQAGTMGPVKPLCSPDNVTVSGHCNAWDLGISALYLQPNTNSALLNPILNAGNDKFHSVDSSWDWGFLLEGSYHFNTGNDLNLNWLHFDNDNFDELAVFFADAAIPITNITNLKFDTHLDVVNLEFAQTSHFGKKTNIRFYGGGQYVYAKIKRGEFGYQQLPSDPANLVQRSITHTRFQGAGPRVGVDMSHDLNHGFAVFAQSAMALLSGQGRAKLSGANLCGPNATPFNAKAKQTHIVPELEAKLGASYQWCTNSGQFSLMAGWMWQHYFDLLLLPPGGYTNPVTTVSQHDFSLDGPFIKGKWVSG
ncbi:Lpg1974 family pore-forming outer membrane protein [Legionella tucsonensis]|nr:Lpg1974 family pore-forming outer membrane protein [Legionella tucsonensis]